MHKLMVTEETYEAIKKGKQKGTVAEGTFKEGELLILEEIERGKSVKALYSYTGRKISTRITHVDSDIRHLNAGSVLLSITTDRDALMGEQEKI
jgi:hypothetical protein